MHTQKDPNGEAIVRLGLDLLDASEKLHPVVNDLMAYKRLSKADAACRAIIRPPAGRLKKPYTPAAVSDVTIDAMSGITVAAAIHTPIRNGATYRCSTFRTVIAASLFSARRFHSEAMGQVVPNSKQQS